MKLVKVTQTYFNDLKQLIVKAWNGKSDTRTAKNTAPYGVDSNPIKDCVAIYAKTEMNGKEYIIGYVNKDLVSQVGESRLFSTDSNGGLQFNVWLSNDGKLYLGTSDLKTDYQKHLARFEELKQGFDQFKADFNTHITNYNVTAALVGSHVHPYVNVVTPSVTSPSATPGTASVPTAATIDQSKINIIKVE